MSTPHLVKCVCVCHGYVFLWSVHEGLESISNFQGGVGVIDLKRIYESGNQQTLVNFSDLSYSPAGTGSSATQPSSQPIIRLPDPQFMLECGCRLCGGLEVPQRPYQPIQLSSDLCHHSGETLYFSKGGCGLPVLDAVQNRLSGLEGGDDLVFTDAAVSTFSLRIEWPGYPTWTGKFRAKNWGGTNSPVTRARLVSQLGKRIAEFIEAMEDVECGDFAWKVGSKNIKADGLVLVSLTRVSKGSWQPLVRLMA